MVSNFESLYGLHTLGINYLDIMISAAQEGVSGGEGDARVRRALFDDMDRFAFFRKDECLRLVRPGHYTSVHSLGVPCPHSPPVIHIDMP